MTAPILLMPRAADITTAAQVVLCYLWVEETPATLATWVVAEDDGG